MSAEAAHIGDYKCYRRGCGEDVCRDAHRRYKTRRRLHVMHHGPTIIDNVGVRRRLLALGVARWTSAELADRLGMDDKDLRKLKHSARVMRSTDEKITALYAELEHLTGTGGAYTESIARKYGGLPPADWECARIDDPDSWPETFDTRTWSCQAYKHRRCTGQRLLTTELGTEPAPCGCSCHDTEEN